MVRVSRKSGFELVVAAMLLQPFAMPTLVHAQVQLQYPVESEIACDGRIVSQAELRRLNELRGISNNWLDYLWEHRLARPKSPSETGSRYAHRAFWGGRVLPLFPDLVVMVGGASLKENVWVSNESGTPELEFKPSSWKEDPTLPFKLCTDQVISVWPQRLVPPDLPPVVKRVQEKNGPDSSWFTPDAYPLAAPTSANGTLEKDIAISHEDGKLKLEYKEAERIEKRVPALMRCPGPIVPGSQRVVPGY